MPDIILASGSSYRSNLLKKLHFPFATFNTEVDESRLDGESAVALAQRLAESKARAAATTFPNHLIIASDQVACCNEEILGKPGARAAAIEQLCKQSGQQVQFHTALCLLNSQSGHCLHDIDTCSVHFRPLTAQQIERYVDIEQPYDCAGSFKSEGYGIVLFEKIIGDDPNALIGLPLIKLTRILAHMGVALP